MRISDCGSDVCSSELVVIGTSGLTAADYDALDAEARKAGVGVLAAGNFSLTAALVQHFALIAARHIGHFEVIDYAKAAKPDAPSGTAREMAERLGDVRKPELGYPLDKVGGTPYTPGGTVTRVPEIGSSSCWGRLCTFVLISVVALSF